MALPICMHVHLRDTRASYGGQPVIISKEFIAFVYDFSVSPLIDSGRCRERGRTGSQTSSRDAKEVPPTTTPAPRNARSDVAHWYWSSLPVYSHLTILPHLHHTSVKGRVMMDTLYRNNCILLTWISDGGVISIEIEIPASHHKSTTQAVLQQQQHHLTTAQHSRATLGNRQILYNQSKVSRARFPIFNRHHRSRLWTT